MVRILSLIVLIAAAGAFLIFYRRKLNVMILVVVLVIGVGAAQRLLTMTEPVLPIVIALGAFGLIWVFGWIIVRYVELKRERERSELESSHRTPKSQ